LELIIELVLSVAQNVTPVRCRSCVRLVPVRLSYLIILTQVRVERALAMSWSVVEAKTTGRVTDVGVTATTVVDVHYRLGVNICQVVSWALLQELECAKVLDFAWLLGWAESTVVTIDIAITASAICAVVLGLRPMRGSVVVHLRER